MGDEGTVHIRVHNLCLKSVGKTSFGMLRRRWSTSNELDHVEIKCDDVYWV